MLTAAHNVILLKATTPENWGVVRKPEGCQGALGV